MTTRLGRGQYWNVIGQCHKSVLEREGHAEIVVLIQFYFLLHNKVLYMTNCIYGTCTMRCEIIIDIVTNLACISRSSIQIGLHIGLIRFLNLTAHIPLDTGFVLASKHK